MRKALAILAAVFSLTVAAERGVEARDAVFRSVAIDTSRLAARGHGQLGAALKPVLVSELSKAMGPRLGRSGGQLVIRITRIELPNSAGEDNYGGQADDSLEGVIVVPGRGQIPIRIVLPQSGAGAWNAEQFDQRRVYRLIEALAQWTAREV